MHGKAGGTLLPLLFDALHGDPCQHGVGCVDAVAVESDFVHGPIIGGYYGKGGQIETTSPGATFNHLIGAPLVRRQIVMGSSDIMAIL